MLVRVAPGSHPSRERPAQLLRRGMLPHFAAKLFHQPGTTLHFRIQRVLVAMIVAQGGMDLLQRQVRKAFWSCSGVSPFASQAPTSSITFIEVPSRYATPRASMMWTLLWMVVSVALLLLSAKALGFPLIFAQ